MKTGYLFLLFAFLGVTFASAQEEMLYLTVESNSVDGVWLKLNTKYDTPPVPSRYGKLPPEHLKLVNGRIVEKTASEKAIMELPRKHRRVVSGRWEALDTLARKQADEEEQAAKSDELKLLENEIITEARGLGVIAREEMSLSETNMPAMVEAIRGLSASERNTRMQTLMANEFALKYLGGSIDDVHWHEDVK